MPATPGVTTLFDRQGYIDNLLDYYQNPRNKGRIDGADTTMSGGNPGCGDVVTMYVNVDDGIAREIRFEGQGCTISQAGASMVAEKYQGKPLEAIDGADVDDMIDEIGRQVVISRVRCAIVGIGSLKAPVQQLRNDAIMRDLEAGARPTP